MRPAHGIPYLDKYFPMHAMNPHISPMGCHGMGVGGTLWDPIGYCGSMHGRQRVLLVEGMGPHSAGIMTTASADLGFHICLDPFACLFDQFPGSIHPSGYCSRGTSVLLSHYQPVGVWFNT